MKLYRENFNDSVFLELFLNFDVSGMTSLTPSSNLIMPIIKRIVFIKTKTSLAKLKSHRRIVCFLSTVQGKRETKSASHSFELFAR